MENLKEPPEKPCWNYSISLSWRQSDREKAPSADLHPKMPIMSRAGLRLMLQNQAKSPIWVGRADTQTRHYEMECRQLSSSAKHPSQIYAIFT